MKHPCFVCDHCGSSSIRRSRRQSLAELSRMAKGEYPFRCMDCDNRFWVSVWLFSKVRYAKCPHCLSLKLKPFAHEPHHRKMWRNLLLAFGARQYRCASCKHSFTSFRKPDETVAPPGFETFESPHDESDNDAGGVAERVEHTPSGA